jgi:hypothetical protein
VNQHRIGRLLESRSLEALPAADDEVVAMWAAALREWSDSSVAGLSLAGAFTHVYQAAFRAATALMRSAGYRSRGAVGGHHHVTFYVAAALGDAELERSADRMQNIRGGRHMALYGDVEGLEVEDLEDARGHVRQFLVHARRWLVTSRPVLADRLGSLPPPREI